MAVRGALREVLEHVTLGQVLRGDLPPAVTRFTEDPDAWITRVYDPRLTDGACRGNPGPGGWGWASGPDDYGSGPEPIPPTSAWKSWP